VNVFLNVRSIVPPPYAEDVDELAGILYGMIFPIALCFSRKPPVFPKNNIVILNKRYHNR
jgi:hypothetical protein